MGKYKGYIIQKIMFLMALLLSFGSSYAKFRICLFICPFRRLYSLRLFFEKKQQVTYFLMLKFAFYRTSQLEWKREREFYTYSLLKFDKNLKLKVKSIFKKFHIAGIKSWKTSAQCFTIIHDLWC